MSPARPGPFNLVVPRTAEPSPGERGVQVGPGWSWAAFFTPWRLGSPTPKYRWTTFGTDRQAIDDLVRCLDDGNAGVNGSRCAKELRVRRPRGELVLCDGTEWAYVVSKVSAGEHLSDVADRRFTAWHARVAPRRAEVIMAKRPVLF